MNKLLINFIKHNFNADNFEIIKNNLYYNIVTVPAPTLHKSYSYYNILIKFNIKNDIKNINKLHILIRYYNYKFDPARLDVYPAVTNDERYIYNTITDTMIHSKSNTPESFYKSKAIIIKKYLLYNKDYLNTLLLFKNIIYQYKNNFC